MKDGADTVSAIASRRGDLTELVSNTNSAMRAIGDENVALQRALELLPGTLRKANTTFVNLRNTLDDLDKLVEESKPNTKELAPFFKALRPLVHDARPTVADLRDLIRLPGPNNDLIELTAKQPRLAELTASVFPRAIRTLDRSDPVISYAAALHPGPVGLAHRVRPGGRVLRRERPLRARAAGVQPDEVRPRPVQAHRRPARRPPEPASSRDSRPDCPGGATQPTPDGSAPWAVNGCEPADDPQLRGPTRAMRRFVYLGLIVALLPWIVIGIVRESTDDDTKDHYFVRAIFDNASTLVPGEDVKVAGVPVGVISTSTSRPTRRPRSRCASTTRASSPGRATPSARSARRA